jgi:hypothetical protein
VAKTLGPRSPPGLREETDLHRLDEDLVHVVSETLQPQQVSSFPSYRGPITTLNPSRNVTTSSEPS